MQCILKTQISLKWVLAVSSHMLSNEDTITPKLKEAPIAGLCVSLFHDKARNDLIREPHLTKFCFCTLPSSSALISQ